MEENLSLSTRQKALGIVLILFFLGTVSYFIYTKTTWLPFGKGLENAIKNSSYTIPAGVDNPLLSAVLFCDFSLPECRQTKDAFELFQDDFPNDLSITYAHYFTTENGRKAAIATLLAGESVDPLMYQDLLYGNQNEWYDAEDPTPSFITYAGEVGIDEEAFAVGLANALQTNSSYDKALIKAVEKAAAIGVATVPTTFINNKKVEVQLTYEALTNYLENKGSWVEPTGTNDSPEYSEYENSDIQLDAGLHEGFEEDLVVE